MPLFLATGLLTGGCDEAHPFSGLVEVPLGPLSAEVTVDVPPQALGVHFFAWDRSLAVETSVQVVQLEAPNGETIVNGGMFIESTHRADEVQIVSVGVPHSDRPTGLPTIMTGRWKFTVDAYSVVTDELVVDGTAWIRQTEDGLFHGGAIDVRVFLHDMNRREYVEAVIRSAYTDFAGLSLGSIQFFELAPEFAVIPREAAAVFDVVRSLPTEISGPVITLVIPEMIDDGVTLAFAPLVGVPFARGTARDVVVWELADEPTLDRSVLRHETGHFAGLFHTSEEAPGAGDFDMLADTPQCFTFESDEGANCPDRDNLMFPLLFPDVIEPVLTDSQIAIIRASAIYRGVTRADAELEAPAVPLIDETLRTEARSWSVQDPWERALLTGLACGPERVLRLASLGEARLRAIVDERDAPLIARLRSLAVLVAIGALDRAELDVIANDARLPARLRNRARLFAMR